MKKFKTLLAGALLASLTSAPAFAATFTPGTWQVYTTVASTGAYWNTFHVCLESSGDWYMLDQDAGLGHWDITGTSAMHWRGNIADLNDSAELTIKSSKLMTGPLQQWIDGSTVNGVAPGNLVATSTWTFVANTCAKPF